MFKRHHTGFRARVLACAAVGALVSALATPAHATDIDLITAWKKNGETTDPPCVNCGGWGDERNTDYLTIGQTFTAFTGATTLQSFSFYLFPNRTGSAPQYQAFIYHVQNQQMVGSALFSSPLLNAPTTFGEVTFDTGGVHLTAGEQYVFFITTQTGSQTGNIDYRVGTVNANTIGSVNVDKYSGGSYVVNPQAHSLAELSASPWLFDNHNDLAFLAHFGQPIDTSAPFFLSSDLDGTVLPDFEGGTLRIAANGTIADAFTVGNVAGNTIDLNGRTVDMTGAFNGSGGLTINDSSGGGTIRFLTTSTLFTGPLLINAGHVTVNALNGTFPVTVKSGGLLDGSGAVGTVTVAAGGRLSPGNTVGNLTIFGNLSLAPNAQYISDVTPGISDRTVVTGAATLGGANLSFATSGGAYVAGRSYTLLTASGGVNGTFTTGNLSGVFGYAVVPTISYTATSVLLSLAPNAVSPYLPAGAGSNQVNVGHTIDTVIAGGGTIPAEFLALFALPLSSVPGALSQLTNQIGASAGATQFEDMQDFLTLQSDPDSGGQTHVQPAALTNLTGLRLWAAGTGGRLTADTQSGSRFGSNGGQFAVGADFGLAPQSMLGVAVSYGQDDFDLAALGMGRSSALQFGLNGSTRLDDFHISASAGLAFYNTSTLRDVRFPGAIGRYSASFDAIGYGLRAEAGRDFVRDDVTLTPFVGVSAEAIDSPAYAETTVFGATSLATIHQRDQLWRVRSELGLAASTPVDDGGDFVLRGRLAWAHALRYDRTATMSFQFFPSSSFAVEGVEFNRDAALASVGVQASLSDMISLRVNVAGEAGPDAQSVSGNAALHLAW